MKAAKFAFGWLAVVALCAPAFSQETKKKDEPKKAEWVKIVEKAKYEVEFPSKPKEMGPDGAKQYILETEGGKAAFLSQYNAFPKSIDLTDEKLLAAIFENAAKGLEKAFKGSKVVADKASKFGKFPQKDVDLEVPELGLYRTRWILTTEGFYQLTVLGPKDYVNGADATKFFKTFKLKDD